jgi:hypothetical protein
MLGGYKKYTGFLIQSSFERPELTLFGRSQNYYAMPAFASSFSQAVYAYGVSLGCIHDLWVEL